MENKYEPISQNQYQWFRVAKFDSVSVRFAIVCQEHLVIVGGGKRPIEAMSKFVEWAGKENAHILIIPWATAEPEASFKSLKEDFEPFHPKEIELAPIAPLTDRNQKRVFETIKKCNGRIFHRRRSGESYGRAERRDAFASFEKKL